MTTEHDTTEAADTVLESQAHQGAKRAAVILQQSDASSVAEENLESVYLDTGAGLALAIDNAGRFTFAGLERDGRPLLTLTAEETRALYRFWLPICTQAVLQQIAAAVADRKREQQAKEDVVALLEERKQTRILQRVIDIAVAPNCQPDTLSYPPRIVTAPDGSQRLQMRNDKGWDTEDDYPVLEVTRMDGHGLVLVGIGEQAILMTAQDFDTPAE